MRQVASSQTVTTYTPKGGYRSFEIFEFFAVPTEMTYLTFLPMLYMWPYASILSYVKMLSCAKDLIPGICGQNLNNSELHKYQISMQTFFSANVDILR